MKKLILASLLITSCAHYIPVEMGTGNYSGKQVESCTSVILEFPTSPKQTRLDTTLRKHDLTSEDVFSVEREIWFYLWPIYSYHCTVVSLNDSSKNASKGESINKQYKTVNGSVDSDFENLKSIKECNQFSRLTKSRCRKYFSKKKK